MWWHRRAFPWTAGGQDGRGTLAGLLRDRAGNTLAIMAMALIPVSALAGSAIDTGRLYVVKVRLQQACDAGALAGRKFMTDGNNTQLDANAKTQAQRFFDNNFRPGWMQVTSPSFTPVKTTDNQVSARATAVVPMTIMKMFQAPDVTLSVSCQARYDVPDVDVVFVLDTTGSMACPPEMDDDDCTTFSGNQAKVAYQRPSNTGGVSGYAGSTSYYVTESTKNGVNNSRIQALRQAVIDFQKTMASNVDPSTNVRYGFVTYSSMVNPGQAILDKSSGYMLGGAGSSGSSVWRYQSRQVTADYETASTINSWNNRSQADCGGGFPKSRDPATFLTFKTDGTATQLNEKWLRNGNKNQCASVTQTLGPVWTYRPMSYSINSFVAGNSVTTPSQVASATSKWLGCIEEATTTTGTTSFDINNLPNDLNPDLTPATDDQRWKPLWPEVEYLRPSTSDSPAQQGETGTNGNYTNYVDVDRLILGKMACGKPIQRLKKMNESEVSAYVNAPDFRALGGTYHDIGMIWGLRLLSTRGIFSADTSAWPGRPAPKRVLVFLTDGSMSPSVDAYSVYGVEMLDRRVTNGDTSNRITYHNARFAALCDKAQAMNIDVWTVAIAPDDIQTLKDCASSPAQGVHTTSGTELSDTFKSIAQRVAMLRITQ